MIAKHNTQRLVFGYALVAPAFLLMLLFFVWPFIQGFLTSLRGGMGFDGPFVGLKNYSSILRDPRFWNSFKVSLIFTTLFIVLSGGLGLIMAMLLLKRPRGYEAILAIAFIPYISTPVIGALVWTNMLAEPFGLINGVLGTMGLSTVPFLKNPVLALSSLILIQVWYTLGYNAILFLSGLQAIPISYFEAAEVEGCGFFQRMRYITLPLIIPTIVFVVTVSTMYGFINSYVLAKLITGGGPFEATNVMMAYIFELGFDRFRFGKANAATMLMFVMFLGVSFSQFNYQRRKFSGLH